jgi:hypothetical protein
MLKSSLPFPPMPRPLVMSSNDSGSLRLTLNDL